VRVAVVGAGVIGLAVAWRCALRGMDVTVYDPDPARAAAHVAAGMLAPVTELHYGEEALLALNLDSARRWPAFAAALVADAGVDPGYVQSGTVAVARDADDVAALDALRCYQTELGLHAEWLTGRELRRREPTLAPTVRGGLFVAGDHQVESRRLLRALGRRARGEGSGWWRRRSPTPPRWRDSPPTPSWWPPGGARRSWCPGCRCAR